MTVARVVLDTDILSGIMRQNPVIIAKAREYLAEHNQFTFSIITRFEILRGLKAKGATTQVSTFDEFCTRNIILPLTDKIVVKAADIYGNLRGRGLLIRDADILIAATALVEGLGVVTNNENHFQRIRNIQLENWLK